MLKPLPDREEFEWEIRNLLVDGDITDSARYLQMDRTNLSRMLNPGVSDRHNPFWLATALIWTFDAKHIETSDRILGLIQRRRMMWLPPAIALTDPAKTTARIGTELMELIEKELQGCTNEELLKEAVDIRIAVEAKIAEILARRGL